MCRSVPQIDAAFTRTSTSVGPIAGTATVSICKPRAGCIFRNAFMVDAIYSGPRPTHKVSMLAQRFGAHVALAPADFPHPASGNRNLKTPPCVVLLRPYDHA